MIMLVQEHRTICKLPFPPKRLANLAIEASAKHCECPYEFDVELILTTDADIEKMNAEFRNIEKATDVLSFPLLDFQEPCDFSLIETLDDSFDLDTGRLQLGTIVISREKLMEQADSYNHSPEREYSFLLVHAMLHLFGYDHIEEDDRLIMEKEQKEILNAINQKR